MGQRKYFGTDGIRGRVGLSLINSDFVWALGHAFAHVLSHSTRKIVIGKDTRASGDELEAALIEGLIKGGIHVIKLGILPTPAVAYLTKLLHADAGIVISASHNLYEDNGIKFFSSVGKKLSDEFEVAIEQELEHPRALTSRLGRITQFYDAQKAYLNFCRAMIPEWFNLSSLKIVVDCAHGATFQVVPKLLQQLHANVSYLGIHPDGENINEGCGSTAPERLQEKVLEQKADLGIAFDGDGDRLLLVDAHGNILDGDTIIYILAKYAKASGSAMEGVVGTVMSNYGLEQAISDLGMKFKRSEVGDRNVLRMLENNHWSLGGEPSGHIINLDKTSTIDGFIIALQILFIMTNNHLPLHDLANGLKRVPQLTLSYRTPNVALLLNHPEVNKLLSQIKKKLNKSGRIIFRPSGTEPLLRIMIEAVDEKLVKQCAQELKDTLKCCDEKIIKL